MTWFRTSRDKLFGRITLAKCYADSGLVNDSDHFSVSSIQYGKQYLKKFVRLVVRREVDGELICFSGTSENSISLAAKKAFSEFLEAKTIWDRRLPIEQGRSGWATYTTMTGAIQRGYRELVERDSFLTHFLTPSLGTQKLFVSEIPDLVACQLQSADDSLTVVLAGQRQPKSGIWLLGLGCSPEIAKSRDNAIQEVMMLRFQFNDRGPIADATDFEFGHYRDHLISAGECAVSSRLQSLFNGRGNISLTYRTHQEESKVSESRTFGKFSVARIVHPTLLPLTFDSIWLSSQNDISDRLQRKGIKECAWAVHPFI